MNTTAAIYPNSKENPTIKNSDPSKGNIGLCFSGGGSRALTCAWGQMMGLSELGLMEKAKYQSSVSGGTWASSIYAFLPDSISDKELLGTYCKPEDLSLSTGSGKFDITAFQTDHVLGHAPNGMHLETLIKDAAVFLIEHCFDEKDYKWLWAYLIGKLVLDPYSLRSQGEHPWSSTKSFTLSKDYASKNFPNSGPKDFYFINNSKRPFIIMNNNLMQTVGSNIVQLPNQVTPIAGGVKGETPDKEIIGGGLVESYGVCSTLDQTSADSSPVDISTQKAYSLIDIVSTSSAFFAQTLAKELVVNLKDDNKKKDLISNVKGDLSKGAIESLFEKAKEDIKDEEDLILKMIEEHLEKIVISDSFLKNVIPEYNYWSLGEKSTNTPTKYTDGGTLENTGILGLLAQTDKGSETEELKIIAFDNTETPLIKIGDNIIAGGQAAPLFGVDFDESTGEYKKFSKAQKDPTSTDFVSTSLIQVFNNESLEFTDLLNGLYASNSKNGENTAPAFFEMDLVTVENTLANISSGRKIKLLYVQNAKMLDWQNSLGDDSLKEEILKGQKENSGTFSYFKGFPNYSTFTKIGLYPKESNALSQMWAWAVCDDTDLTGSLKDFFS